MKKIVLASVAFLLMSAAVMAQSGPGDRMLKHRTEQGFRDGRITRGERFELRKDATRYKMAERNARRDGRVTPYERRRIHALKARTRHDAFRFRHNRRHRII